MKDPNQEPVSDLLQPEEESFAALFEKSLKSFQVGEIVTGRVVAIKTNEVMVDIGYKSEGVVPIDEFQDYSGNMTVKVGEEVEVLLEDLEDAEGYCVLSKERADKLKVWNLIVEAYKEGRSVTGKIIRKVKGGLSVDIGIRAFLPGSQVDLRPTRNLEKYLGQVLPMKIIKLNRLRNNVVLSRRVLLEEERAVLREEAVKRLVPNAIVKGVVKNITDYGAFIDLGWIDGLLHITDMTWGRIDHPSELFSVGDEVEVVVLNYDPETGRVSLGYKQKTQDPWSAVVEKYPEASRVRGKVVSITDYGAFVELEEGVEGLVHVSEMSWTKKIRHPSKVVDKGDIIETVVLSVDPVAKKISLGMRQVEPNPWQVVSQKYQPGDKISGKVRNITDFGVFVDFGEGIDGLVHVSDISWTKKVKHPGELFKKGQTVEAVILHIDPEKERVSLSIKHMTPDPWQDAPSRYPVGTQVKGTVTSVTDFGVFVALEGDVEGLIHISELSADRIDHPSQIFKPGDEVNARVIRIIPAEQKIGLSIKSPSAVVEREREREQVTSYTQDREPSRPSLGDLVSEQLGGRTLRRRKKKDEYEAADDMDDEADA